jgi:hypothetical protein
MKSTTHFRSYLAQYFLEREMFQTKVVEEMKTHILCSMTFYVFFEKLEKIQVSLKSDKNNGYFTWRALDIFDHISLNIS